MDWESVFVTVGAIFALICAVGFGAGGRDDSWVEDCNKHGMHISQGDIYVCSKK